MPRVVIERTERGRTTRAVYHSHPNLPVAVGTDRTAHLIRGHWCLENILHRAVLDDTFRKDRCQLRPGPAAQFRSTGVENGTVKTLSML